LVKLAGRVKGPIDAVVDVRGDPHWARRDVPNVRQLQLHHASAFALGAQTVRSKKQGLIGQRCRPAADDSPLKIEVRIIDVPTELDVTRFQVGNPFVHLVESEVSDPDGGSARSARIASTSCIPVATAASWTTFGLRLLVDR